MYVSTGRIPERNPISLDYQLDNNVQLRRDVSKSQYHYRSKIFMQRCGA